MYFRKQICFAKKLPSLIIMPNRLNYLCLTLAAINPWLQELRITIQKVKKHKQKYHTF